jgi:hypothetical protein
MPVLTTILFLLSSAISFGLIYLKLSTVFSQQIISVVLLFSVVLLGKFNNVKKTQTPWQTGIAVLLSSFLVQMLVISSGGLYSHTQQILQLLGVQINMVVQILNGVQPLLNLKISFCLIRPETKISFYFIA